MNSWPQILKTRLIKYHIYKSTQKIDSNFLSQKISNVKILKYPQMSSQGVHLCRLLHILQDYKNKLQMDHIKVVVVWYLKKILKILLIMQINIIIAIIYLLLARRELQEWLTQMQVAWIMEMYLLVIIQLTISLMNNNILLTKEVLQIINIMEEQIIILLLLILLRILLIHISTKILKTSEIPLNLKLLSNTVEKK